MKIDNNLLLDLFGEYRNIFLTSDNHFGHENIIRFCNRPFPDAITMDERMIDSWNRAVTSRDVVVHLGDFTLYGEDYAQSLLSQLTGKILFVTPDYHHDKRWIEVAKNNRVEACYWAGDFCLLSGELAGLDMDITLCHYPLEEWDRSFHGSLHFHGHTHGNLPMKKNRLDVGVDCHNFTPILLSQAVMQAKQEIT